MYRKSPNNLRGVDLILGVQEGDRSNFSPPPPKELYWGMRQLTFQKSTLCISVCTAVYGMVSSRFFESEANEIYSHVSEKAGILRQKARE